MNEYPLRSTDVYRLSGDQSRWPEEQAAIVADLEAHGRRVLCNTHPVTRGISADWLVTHEAYTQPVPLATQNLDGQEFLDIEKGPEGRARLEQRLAELDAEDRVILATIPLANSDPNVEQIHIRHRPMTETEREFRAVAVAYTSKEDNHGNQRQSSKRRTAK